MDRLLSLTFYFGTQSLVFLFLFSCFSNSSLLGVSLWHSTQPRLPPLFLTLEFKFCNVIWLHISCTLITLHPCVSLWHQREHFPCLAEIMRSHDGTIHPLSMDYLNLGGILVFNLLIAHLVYVSRWSVCPLYQVQDLSNNLSDLHSHFKSLSHSPFRYKLAQLSASSEGKLNY